MSAYTYNYTNRYLNSYTIIRVGILFILIIHIKKRVILLANMLKCSYNFNYTISNFVFLCSREINF